VVEGVELVGRLFGGGHWGERGIYLRVGLKGLGECRQKGIFEKLDSVLD
jgi:hypothetical protein